ncbi:exonuclease SbcCD subunit D [Thermodesulfobacteriota bacterium]
MTRIDTSAMLDTSGSSGTLRPRAGSPRHPVRLLHTSDLHIGSGYGGADDGEWPERAVAYLNKTVELAHEHSADLMIIAGDLFDHNRVSGPLVGTTGALLECAAIPVVILPGNHDPYMEESIYGRNRSLFPDNVHIIREEVGELIVLADPGVQVWGQAHTGYYDFGPARAAPSWNHHLERSLWRVAVVHGVYVRSDYETRFSYQIQPHELEELGAHYVGLGHLELHGPVGPDGAVAYYSGSPERSGGATVVDLTPQGVEVRHVKHETVR